MNQDIKTHLDFAKRLFESKLQLHTLWQEIADNFYPERANFTVTRSLGDDFASHLYSSYPLVKSRDLSDQIGAMLRPKSTPWFEMGLIDDRYEDQAAKQWFENAVRIMRRAMYDPTAKFQRATKENDRDFCNFGNCVFSVVLNKKRNGLLYRNHHLRDVAWCEGAYGNIDRKYVKWKMTKDQMTSLFGDKVHDNVKNCKDGSKEFQCMHMVVPAESYGIKTTLPNVSLWVDVDNEHELEAIPYAHEYYRISRWATCSDSQYAYSPAMIAALPDARLFQDMTRVLLEAGEKAVDPPMVATDQVIRSDLSLYAGGVTYVDRDYDEKLGQALRPLSIDRSGIPLGMDMADRVQLQLAQALYLDKFNLPAQNEMTAYEASIRFEEYRRTILPIFEPMEEENSAQLVQETFDVMFRAGAFGNLYDIPESIRENPDYEFKFISPITESEDQKKVNRFFAVQQVLQSAATIDPGVVTNLNTNRAVREAIEGAGADADWLVEEEEAVAAQLQYQQRQQAQKEMEMADQALGVAKEAKNVGQGL